MTRWAGAGRQTLWKRQRGCGGGGGGSGGGKRQGRAKRCRDAEPGANRGLLWCSADLNGALHCPGTITNRATRGPAQLRYERRGRHAPRPRHLAPIWVGAAQPSPAGRIARIGRFQHLLSLVAAARQPSLLLPAALGNLQRPE